MDVTNVNNTVQTTGTATTNNTATEKTNAEKQTQQNSGTGAGVKNSNSAAVYEAGDTKNQPGKYPVDRKEVERLIKESENQTASFRRLLEGLLQKQAKRNAVASGKDAAVEYDDLLNKVYNGQNVMVEVDEETRLQAKKDIAEDGYYGVKKTSERILDFAKAISGGDPKKIATLRNAVEKGFKAVEDMWGGKDKLPKISYDTYDAVMKGFDEWEKGSNPAEPIR